MDEKVRQGQEIINRLLTDMSNDR